MNFSPLELLLALSLALIGGTLLLRWPIAGVLVGVALLYLNIPALAVKLHGIPAPIAAAPAALMLPAILQNVASRNRAIVDVPFLLMIVFFGWVITSVFYAKDTGLALGWIAKFATEGIVLYGLVLNVIRSGPTLRSVVWVLLVCGSLLASLTLYQELGRAYSNEFGGLAQRTLERMTDEDVAAETYLPRDRPKINIANRAQGPIDDPNRYAQMLIVLLPLAIVCFKNERRRLIKVGALAAFALILGGVLLTYSRGGFLALVAMTLVAAILGTIRMRDILVAVALFIAATAVAPGYSGRILSLRGLQGLVEKTSQVEPDAVARNRATEMLAAWNVFTDHPVLGVGPGQFASLYSVDYMNENYSLRRVTEQRRAHSLYLEMAAETGILGIGLFLCIAFSVIYRLIGVWRRFRVAEPEMANIAEGFVIAIAGYLVSAIFLQLSFQRYFWFLLALAGVAVQVAHGRSVTAARPLAPEALVPRELPAAYAGEGRS